MPGWNPEAVVEIQRVVNVIREAAQLQTPGLAEATTRAAAGFVRGEINAATEAPQTFVIVGGPGAGTDAPGWVIDEDGTIHKVPGWNPEAVVEVQHAVNIIREAAQLKTPGLAEATAKAAVDFVQNEVVGLVGAEGVAVFG